MRVKRTVLLLIGIAGSLLAATVLCVSARDILMAGVPLEAAFELPLPIPDTTLVAKRLSSYDGPFLEDGSDREVVGVAALLVHNVGNKEILTACVLLQLDEAVYTFCGEHIPPGAEVLLLEHSGKSYVDRELTACSGCQSVAQTDPITGIAVADRAMGTLVVTNETDQTLENVQIYYKMWLSPPDIYVGGIAYMTEIPKLLPGETKHIYPGHYACGYSKVVSVTAESQNNSCK